MVYRIRVTEPDRSTHLRREIYKTKDACGKAGTMVQTALQAGNPGSAHPSKRLDEPLPVEDIAVRRRGKKPKHKSQWGRRTNIQPSLWRVR